MSGEMSTILWIWREGNRERIQPELPVQIAARPKGNLIKTLNRAHDPARIHGFTQNFQIFSERGVPQHRLSDSAG